MPDTMYLHNQLSRGGTWSRWSDQNIVVFERYDYREGNGSQPQTQAVALFAMNDETGYPGDITFDDGVTRTSDGYYLNPANTQRPPRFQIRAGVGIVVGFAPGSVLAQLASSSPTGGRAYPKLLVHGATHKFVRRASQCECRRPDATVDLCRRPNPPARRRRIELNMPSDAWVMYGYQWPEASRANPSTNAIVLRQGGV